MSLELSGAIGKTKMAGVLLVIVGVAIIPLARFLASSALIVAYALGTASLVCGSYVLAITSIVEGRRLRGYAHLALTTVAAATIIYMAVSILRMVTPER